MASEEELGSPLPETLPEDFSEWDGAACAKAAPENKSSEWEAWEAAHPQGETPKPVWQSDDRDAILESLMDRPRVAGSISATPVVVKQPKDLGNWNKETSPAGKRVNTSEWEAWDAAHSADKMSKPAGPSTARKAAVPPVSERPRASGPISPAPSLVRPQRDHGDRGSESLAASTSARAAAAPVKSDEWEAWEAAHSFSKAPRPSGHAGERGSISPMVTDRPRDTHSASSGPISLKTQMSTTALLDAVPTLISHAPEASHATSEAPAASSLSSTVPAELPRSTSAHTLTSMRESDEALFQAFSSKKVEANSEGKAGKKKWILIAGASVCLILILLIFVVPMLRRGTKVVAKPSIQPTPATTDSQVNTDTSKPPASEPLMQDKQTAAGRPQSSDAQPTDSGEGNNAGQVQAQMMNEQLDAPAQIPKQVAENGPPPAGLGSGAAEGLNGGGANNSVFNVHSQQVIKPAVLKPIAISTGVATGMLVQKTPPVYPPIAREARVSGTVQLQATITKNGSVKNIHVVNGPAMLRQAAVDAVQTWRYKPYMLNNQPTEVDTTINVVFSLGG
jgi:periplasmic protein TonB